MDMPAENVGLWSAIQELIVECWSQLMSTNRGAPVIMLLQIRPQWTRVICRTGKLTTTNL
jgi:hypothetical protein